MKQSNQLIGQSQKPQNEPAKLADQYVASRKATNNERQANHFPKHNTLAVDVQSSFRGKSNTFQGNGQ